MAADHPQDHWHYATGAGPTARDDDGPTVLGAASALQPLQAHRSQELPQLQLRLLQAIPKGGL